MARIGGSVLGIGIVAGLLGDVLFRDASPGVSVPIWLAALMLVSWLLRDRLGHRDQALPWLIGLALFFAWSTAWRASPVLRLWNGAAVLAAGVAVSVHLRGRIGRAWPSDYVRGAADLARHLIAGAVAAMQRVDRLVWRDGVSAPGVRAFRTGVALAVPVVFVFGGLLTSADPLLEVLVTDLFDWDFDNVVEHGLLILGCGWIAVGWLRSMTAERESVNSVPTTSPWTLGLVEIAVPLGALTLLLAMFVGLQARYMFGGETVLRSTGFTYAEFARRGFFELVFLSVLVVPLLQLTQWVFDRSARAANASFRALVIALSGLVGLVMMSALARMRLYVMAYGLTQDRLYATALMVWIGFVLAWFVVTEVRAQPDRFATGGVLAGFAVLAILNLMNPDALIARTNLARAQSGREFDAEYVARLSVDAVPTVVAAWSSLEPGARCKLRRGLLSRVVPIDDWREWTWAAAAAQAARRVPIDARCPG